MFKNKSLRFRLLTLTLCTILGLAVPFFIVLGLVVKHDEQTVLSTTESVAVQVRDAISAQFFERYGDVQAFGMNPEVQASSKETVSSALNGYVALYGIYDLIIVADTSGKIVGVNTKDPSGKDLPVEKLYGRSVENLDWFKNTIAGNLTEDKEKNFLGTYVEDFHIDPLVSEIYGETRIGNGFSAQLKDKSGKVVGVITNRAGARWVEVSLKESIVPMKDLGFKNPEFFLLDKKGYVFAEIDPLTHNGSLEPSRDLNKLLKDNYLEKKFTAALKAKESKETGSVDEYDHDLKIDKAFGYAAVSGPKFVDSLGWLVMVSGPKEEVMAALNSLQKQAYGVLAVVILVAMTVSYFFSRSLSTTFGALAAQLATNSQEVNQMAGNLSESSTKLSSSTTEQAAALQETVSSIDEVSAMVAKNADNAKKSQESSDQSASVAHKGKQAVDDMINSIEEINKANAMIMSQVEEGNREIAEIVQVISAIGEKTKVINDIVFQTKLLSFNASVEAARAGEHGKGFAVVAEEVGNLAQMSGNSAKEISTMLESSIQRVEQIVNNTKSRVSSLMQDSKSKVEAGSVTARRCGEILDEIVKNVGEVNMMVSEIATASKEQSQGVNEINKAMNQLDQVTQANATSSQDMTNFAGTLRNQSEKMATIVADLIASVEGSSARLRTVSPELKAKLAESPSKLANAHPEESMGGKVIPMQKKHSAAESKPALMKAVSGHDVVPSKNDSRFEEV